MTYFFLLAIQLFGAIFAAKPIDQPIDLAA